MKERNFSFRFEVNGTPEHPAEANGKEYRCSKFFNICSHVCGVVFAMCLISLYAGYAKIHIFGSYLIPLFILAILTVLFPIASMLFGKVRMAVNEDVLYGEYETIPFSYIEKIELWPAWWRYEYWAWWLRLQNPPQNVSGERYKSQKNLGRWETFEYFTSSFLCVKFRDGSSKLFINTYICRNLIELSRHVSTNIFTVCVREVLKEIVLLGLAIGLYVIFDYVRISNKDAFGFALFVFFILCFSFYFIHFLVSMMLSKHFYKEYKFVGQIAAMDTMLLVVGCSTICALIAVSLRLFVFQ